MTASLEQPVLLIPAATGSEPIVYEAYNTWSSIAQDAYAQAQRLAGDIANVTISPVAFNAHFDPQLALANITVPVAPDVPLAALAFNAPTLPVAPPTVDLGTYAGSEAPVLTDVAPTLLLPNTPNVPTVAAPGAAPTIAAPSIPVAPAISMPTVPALQQINLPAVPVFSIPTFGGTAPVFDAPIPLENFSFSPAQYVSALLDTVTSSITSMLAGNGLPAAVALALRNRAYTEVNAEELRTVAAAYDESAARGFFEPSGLLNRRITEARIEAMRKRSAASRDVYVQDQTVAVENLRFAVTAGIQLEGQTIALYNAQTEMQFESAKYALQVALSILTARVSVFNAQSQAYAVDAQVYRDLIAGAMAQVQIYSAEVEAQRAIGEINQQTVALYTAQLQGVNTVVEVYKSQLSAAETIARVNMSEVEAYTAQVRAYSAQIEAQSEQWSAYKTQVDAQLGKAQFYGTTVQAYSERVRAWSATESTKQEATKLQLSQGQLSLDAWKAKVDLYDAQLKGEMARVASVGDMFHDQTSIYAAQAQVTASSAEVDSRRFQLNLAQEQAIVETEMKRADQTFEQMKYTTSVMLEIKKTLATVEAQLAAAAMSAVNIGANLTSSTSESIGYNLGLSYSGSMA